MTTYISPDDLTKAERENGITESEVEICVICRETFDPDNGPCVFITSGEFQGARHVDWYTSCEISQGIRASTPYISGFVHVGCLLEKMPEFKEDSEEKVDKVTKNYQINELEIKHGQYLKTIHNSDTESSIRGFINYLKVFEDGQEDEFGPPVKGKEEKFVIYVLIQGHEYETWIWKFIVVEYNMEGMYNEHVNQFLHNYFENDNVSWVLIWNLGDNVDPDEYYDEHLKDIYVNAGDDNPKLPVITLRSKSGGNYEIMNEENL